MSYGDTWPAPDPNELHIEPTMIVVANSEEPGAIYYMLVRGDRMLESRYTFSSIFRQWEKRHLVDVHSATNAAEYLAREAYLSVRTGPR